MTHNNLGKLNERPLAFTDLETSGDVFGEHEIIEIGLVMVNKKSIQILDTLNVKVKPEHIANAIPAAIERNGYMEENWKDAISLKEAMEMYAEKSEEAIFIAYNATFDWGFMNEAFRKSCIKDSSFERC